MTSEAKRAANRANAKKCTGPKTEAGKFKSRLNALKLGLYSVQEFLPGEARELYQVIHLKILAFYHPQSPMEELLCGQIAKTIWRLRRLEQADTVAHKRAAVSIVANEIGHEALHRDATEFEIDFMLKRQIYDEYAPPPQDESVAPPKESEIKLNPKEPTLLYLRPPPPEFAFLKSYTSKDSKAHGREIAAEIRAVTKHLLQLHDQLEAMQTRRLAIPSQIKLRPVAKNVARTTDHSASAENGPTEAAESVSNNEPMGPRGTE